MTSESPTTVRAAAALVGLEGAAGVVAAVVFLIVWWKAYEEVVATADPRPPLARVGVAAAAAAAIPSCPFSIFYTLASITTRFSFWIMIKYLLPPLKHRYCRWMMMDAMRMMRMMRMIRLM